MTELFVLRNIAAVNFYLYAQDFPIAARGNAVFLGANGSGKSVLLDAIQIVMTGLNRRYLDLNSRVSEGGRGTRTVREACLGLLDDGEGYERQECITYVALGFETADGSRRCTAGVRLEAKASVNEKNVLGFFIVDDVILRFADFVHPRSMASKRRRGTASWTSNVAWAAPCTSFSVRTIAIVCAISMRSSMPMRAAHSLIRTAPARQCVRLSRLTVSTLLEWITEHSGGIELAAAGHRVVHGGGEFAPPVKVTPDVVKKLEAPNPLRQAITLISINLAAPGQVHATRKRELSHEQMSALALGIAIGVLSAFYVFFAGVFTMFGWGTALVETNASFYIGYGASIVGDVIGAVWALVDGCVAGVIIAWIYSLAATQP